MTTLTNEYPQLLLENQLCFPLYACARRVINLYGPYLKPLGITYTQYLVFLVLWEKEEITVGELCRTLFLDNGTITPLLKKMESAGYITRSRAAYDERVVELRLTEAGREMKEKAREIPQKVGGCLRMTKEDAGELYRLLYGVLGEGMQ